MKVAIPSLLFKGHQLITLPNDKIWYSDITKSVFKLPFFISKGEHMLFIPTKMLIQIVWQVTWVNLWICCYGFSPNYTCFAESSLPCLLCVVFRLRCKKVFALCFQLIFYLTSVSRFFSWVALAMYSLYILNNADHKAQWPPQMSPCTKHEQCITSEKWGTPGRQVRWSW